MNRSVRLTPVLVAALLAGLLVVLLAVGWFSQRQAEQVRADLSDQSTMAAQLTALQQAADESGQDALGQAAQAALESLAPAAQDVMVTDYEPVEQQLQSTVSALLEVGFSTQDAGDRARALTAVADVWQAARQDGLTTAAYPEALADEVAHISSYTCGDEGLVAGAPDSSGSEQAVQPASLLPLQQSIYQLNYVSEVYAARAEQGYANVATQAAQLATATDRMGQLATPVLTCYGAFEAPAASYPLVEAADAPQQLTDFTAAIESNARAALADQTLATSADDIEALALILALDSQQLAA
ncbi:hypothetical protein [Rothia nasimurium]|uniref:hypothetical protein n=1 Tax=Rothia nasimurium TaxID=85336 RepID=UPI001F389DB5|nr:hypothetical protein [Rothia nasimurium]